MHRFALHLSGTHPKRVGIDAKNMVKRFENAPNISCALAEEYCQSERMSTDTSFVFSSLGQPIHACTFPAWWPKTCIMYNWQRTKIVGIWVHKDQSHAVHHLPEDARAYVSRHALAVEPDKEREHRKGHKSLSI